MLQVWRQRFYIHVYNTLCVVGMEPYCVQGVDSVLYVVGMEPYCVQGVDSVLYVLGMEPYCVQGVDSVLYVLGMEPYLDNRLISTASREYAGRVRIRLTPNITGNHTLYYHHAYLKLPNKNVRIRTVRGLNEMLPTS